MKRLFTILALIAAILSAILSVLPVSYLAIFPAISALLLGSIAYILSKKIGDVNKIIQFIFLLTIISLAVTVYKGVFLKTDVVNTKELKDMEKESKENAIKEIEELDIDDISIE